MARAPDDLDRRRQYNSGRFIDRAGDIVGRLTVLSWAGRRKGKSYWYCRCSCGQHCTVRLDGPAMSCGCLKKEAQRRSRKVSGSIRDKARTLGLPYSTYRHRLKRGLPLVVEKPRKARIKPGYRESTRRIRRRR